MSLIRVRFTVLISLPDVIVGCTRTVVGCLTDHPRRHWFPRVADGFNGGSVGSVANGRSALVAMAVVSCDGWLQWIKWIRLTHAAGTVVRSRPEGGSFQPVLLAPVNSTDGAMTGPTRFPLSRLTLPFPRRRAFCRWGY